MNKQDLATLENILNTACQLAISEGKTIISSSFYEDEDHFCPIYAASRGTENLNPNEDSFHQTLSKITNVPLDVVGLNSFLAGFDRDVSLMEAQNNAKCFLDEGLFNLGRKLRHQYIVRPIESKPSIWSRMISAIKGWR